MRLLIIARKIDHTDSRVGFFSLWIREFSSKVDSLIVITWQQSSQENLGENVRLISLTGTIWMRVVRLNKLIFLMRKEFDVVFIHMNPEYVLSAGLILRIFRKRMGFWYTHKSITIKRKIAEVLVNTIFSASKESFLSPLFKKKVNIVGHGIVLSHFKEAYSVLDRIPFTMMTSGRISSTKDIETMIRAVYLLHKQGKTEATLRIIGEPAVKSDESYLQSLKQMVTTMKLEKYIEFVGSVHYSDIQNEFASASICLNLSNTGSLDKAVLEAFVSGTLVITSNKAFKDSIDPRFFIERNNDQMLVKAIIAMANLSKEEVLMIRQKHYHEVKENHSLATLVDTILRKI